MSEVWLTHHFVRSGAEAAAVALNLGHTDIDCGAQYAGGKQWNDGARPHRAAAAASEFGQLRQAPRPLDPRHLCIVPCALGLMLRALISPPLYVGAFM
eukprot:COSAG01_NODE_799_length_13501_cov_15.980749_18_plen_98_part_00